MQPFIGLQISAYRINKAEEKGTSGFNLKVHNYAEANVYSRLGFHITKPPSVSNVGFSLDLSWNALLTNNQNHPKLNFKDFGSDFTVCGASIDRNSLEYALTFTKYLYCDLEIYIKASGESFSHAQTFNGLAGIELQW